MANKEWWKDAGDFQLLVQKKENGVFRIRYKFEQIREHTASRSPYWMDLQTRDKPSRQDAMMESTKDP